MGYRRSISDVRKSIPGLRGPIQDLRGSIKSLRGCSENEVGEKRLVFTFGPSEQPGTVTWLILPYLQSSGCAADSATTDLLAPSLPVPHLSASFALKCTGVIPMHSEKVRLITCTCDRVRICNQHIRLTVHYKHQEKMRRVLRKYYCS